jgi:ATP-dependent RNA helicase RhlE
VTTNTPSPDPQDESAIATDSHDTSLPGDPFFELGLAPSIVDDIAAQGLTTPTPIQQEAIPAILAGKDLIGLAQTGTGKTAAYLLPILHRLLDKRKSKDVRRTSVLILAPTRELAYQISDSIKAFSGSFKVRYLTICGGERYDFQIRGLNKGVDIIVATPGRFEDLQARGKVNLDDIEHFVLDEGDQMIDLGFHPAIKRIFETLPKACQTVFFSATMPDEMKVLAETFLTDAVTIKAARAGETVDAIRQTAVLVKGADKRDILLRELQALDGGQVLVFARTRLRTEELAEWLSREGLNADMLHGDMRQAIRQKVLRKFKSGDLQVLVATDVAARGIDVSGLGLVINFDLPETVEAYVHRIGRTGRAGQIGAALSICSVADQEKLAAVASRVGQRMTIIDSDGAEVQEFRPERSTSKGRGRGRPPRHARKGDGARSGGYQGKRDDRGSRPDRQNRPKHKARPDRADGPRDQARDDRPKRTAGGPSKPGKPAKFDKGPKAGKPAKFDKGPKAGKPAKFADHKSHDARSHDAKPRDTKPRDTGAQQPSAQQRLTLKPSQVGGKPGGKFAKKPGGKPGGKPFGKSGGKPFGKSGGKPAGAFKTKPRGASQSARPDGGLGRLRRRPQA